MAVVGVSAVQTTKKLSNGSFFSINHVLEGNRKQALADTFTSEKKDLVIPCEVKNFLKII